MSFARRRQARLTGLVVTATAVTTGLATVPPAHAATGPEASAGQYASVVRLNIGDEANSRTCTATLVDEWWVATAASCFATVPGQPVPAGKPGLPATVTLADGETREVTELAPHADRDLVLARLMLPARGAATAKVSTSAPAAGADLNSAGFGRTKTEWVPDKLHTGTFTLGSTAATTLAITGKGTDAICKGDTGSPLLNAAGELIGVNSRSWQGGCLGTPSAETRTGAIAARTDDLVQWISKTTEPRRSAAAHEVGGADQVRFADWDGDGKPDYISIAANGNVSVCLNRGPNAWATVGRVATGSTTDRSRVRLADYDGDGKADYWVINPNGSVNIWINKDGDTGGGWTTVGQVASGVTTEHARVHFADFNGDLHTDFLLRGTGTSTAYSAWLGSGDVNGWNGIGQIAGGV
ncbi:FG-GAP-like repeat-containing protein [Streptomyces sp. NPDC058459]|uniref:FG-GAP-like repeat-containing protein n=1 Tax=Streptomyces sp. NPDC058459 TaxID=3346508 RepID=UPI0036569150